MKWFSTRSAETAPVSTSQALLQGLASDGGLLMPNAIPKIDWQLADAKLPYHEFAVKCLQPFFVNDPLAPALPNICLQAFNFPVPLNAIDDQTWMLELFHGPTLAFKDFGARFLAECLQPLVNNEKPLLIMVATSGDTGSAVASAFYQKPNTQVVVLYPHQQITEHQQAQITCWGENITALAVEGNFDDCQKCVKSAFTDIDLTQQWHLSTANSINIGRLLPQMVYYAYTSVKLAKQKIKAPTFLVPSGNLGNVTAAHMAKLMGFPLGKIIAVTNANRVLSDYAESGQYQPKPSKRTLANAMDVGNPSNFARLQYLFPDFADFQQQVLTESVDDQQIAQAIEQFYQTQKDFICPHTATAWSAAQAHTSAQPSVIVSTAHPCKFDSVIEKILQVQPPMHDNLKKMIARKQSAVVVKPELNQIKTHI